MTTELRKTGIGVVGDLPWGSHFCHFHETKQDLLDTVLPYFKIGLEQNEFCLWVIPESLTEKEARSALRRAVPDLDRYLAERRIELLPHAEWYLKGGAFDLDRVVAGWLEKLDHALARGYVGMRANGSATWLYRTDARTFREYEQQLSESIANHRMILLCTFPLAASGAADVLDVARVHQVAVALRHGEWDIVETPELKQAKAEIKRLNDELEQRVVERTRELTAANEELRREIAERKRMEEELRLSENHLRLVVETIPGLVWSALPDGSLEFVNSAWLDYTGLALHDIRGWGWQATIQPEDLPAFVDTWRAALATGKPFEAEARVRRADGAYRWFLHRGVSLRDERENIVKWYGALTDIEDRKQTEEQLRKVIDAIPQQIWSGPADGSLDYCNYRWRAYMGLGLEELQGDGWQSMLHPDDRDRVLKAWRESVVNGTPYEQVERHRGADGTYRWFLSRGVPLRDAEGRIERWYGTNTDIEDRKRIEEKLRQSEEQLAEAQRLAHVGSWTWDLRRSLVTWSDELYRIFGFEPQGIDVAHEAMEFIHPEDRDLIMSAVESSLKTNEPYSLYYRVLRPDGGERIVHSRGYVVSDEHGALRVFGTTLDVTERKQAEAALRQLSGQLLRSQDEERRRIARELHDSTAQNLSALMMLLSQVKDLESALEPRARQFIAESLALAEQCLREVRTLSYLLHPPFLDELGLASALRWYTEGFAQRSGIGVTLEVSPELGRLPSDIELALFRIVQESLSNLHQHSGSPVASIRLLRGPSQVVLTITDEGHGMRPEVLEKMQTLGSPIGVGIAGMHERVRQLGGQLEIHSNHQGTTLRVTLPVERGMS